MTATTGLDLSNWLTDAEVCARLGISSRSLYREVEDKRLHPQFRKRERMRPQRVFDPEEVNARMAPAPMRVMPPVSPGTAELARPEHAGGPSLAAETIHLRLAEHEAVLAKVGRLIALAEAGREPPPIWTSLDQAAEVTGLSADLLRKLVRLEALDAVRDKRKLKVRREDLGDLDVRKVLVKAEAKAAKTDVKTGRKKK
jgi:hypothetical protein